MNSWLSGGQYTIKPPAGISPAPDITPWRKFDKKLGYLKVVRVGPEQ